MQDLNDKQLNIRLPQSLYEKLKLIADRQHRPVGQLIRHIAIRYIENATAEGVTLDELASTPPKPDRYMRQALDRSNVSPNLKGKKK